MRGMLIGAALAAVLATAAPADAKPLCASPRGNTVAASRFARVWSRDYEGGDRTAFYACLWRHRGTTKIADVDNSTDGHVSEWIDIVTLAGRYVAFAKRTCTLDGCGFNVKVWDVRRGERVRGTTGFGPADPVELVLTFSGSVGILSSSSDEFFVEALDSAGHHIVDHGPDVGGRFSLRRRTLSWLHGQERRSYVLR